MYTCPWLGPTMWEILWSQNLYWGHTCAGNRGSRQRYLDDRQPSWQYQKFWGRHLEMLNIPAYACCNPCSSRSCLLWKINCTIICSLVCVTNVCSFWRLKVNHMMGHCKYVHLILISVVKNTPTTTVHYHCGGWSEEVNSPIFFLSYMVYL